MSQYFFIAVTALGLAGAALADTPKSGYRAEFLSQLAPIEKRVVSLAELMPAEKYTWRPGQGVRSVSEVFLHIAAANFNLTRLIGTPPPAGFVGKGYDTSTTEKAKVLEAVKNSFAHLREAVLNVSDADADKPSKLFYGDSTYRGALAFIAEHLGEHLGQSIAYARVNGVTPPWTEEIQRLQREQQQKKQ